MNIFEKFSLSREVIIKEGEITLDKQRMMLLPVDFFGNYVLSISKDSEKVKKFYNSIKNGMIELSVPLGKEYLLTYKNFLDRWAKYAAFGGWGLVDYQLIDESSSHGFLNIQKIPLHTYLGSKGITSAADVVVAGMIAGGLSGAFKVDIDAVEVKCICSGDAVCTFYWGPKKYLISKFPDITLKKIGEYK